MALEEERETYKAKLHELLAARREGKFVLIHGDRVVDTFSSYEDAIKAGYQQFKLEPFLVKQVIWNWSILRPGSREAPGEAG